MKKLMSLEDTATITITGRDAVMLRTILGRTKSLYYPSSYDLFEVVKGLLENGRDLYHHNLDDINYSAVQTMQEERAFPQESKKDLMLRELQSKMDALQCEIDKIKGEAF